MLGMYSIAGSRFWCEHPARSATVTTTAIPVERRPSDTDDPNVERFRRLQELDDPGLVPTRTRLRDPKREAIVREVPGQERLAVIRKPAGDKKGGEGHRSAEEHAALERDRDE